MGLQEFKIVGLLWDGENIEEIKKELGEKYSIKLVHTLKHLSIEGKDTTNLSVAYSPGAILQINGNGDIIGDARYEKGFARPASQRLLETAKEIEEQYQEEIDELREEIAAYKEVELLKTKFNCKEQIIKELFNMLKDEGAESHTTEWAKRLIENKILSNKEE